MPGMDQRATFVTVSTADLDAARSFYVDGLGWTPTLDVPGEIVFFQVGHGLMLGFFESEKFALDLGADRSTATRPAGLTLSQNVDSEGEVDRVLSAAAEAGAQIVKPAQHADFGGYHGHFADPNGTIWEIAYNPAWRVEEDGTVRLS
jgi:uncharacterized glyoxalase superfamily protein PhnB